MHALQGNSLPSTDAQSMFAIHGGNVTGVIWDFEQPEQKVSNRSFYTRLIPSHTATPVIVQAVHLESKSVYHLRVYRTGYRANDAYSAYIEMGSPKSLTEQQVSQLNTFTQDLPEFDKSLRSGSTGTIEFTLPMNSNDIVLIKLTRNP